MKYAQGGYVTPSQYIASAGQIFSLPPRHQEPEVTPENLEKAANATVGDFEEWYSLDDFDALLRPYIDAGDDFSEWLSDEKNLMLGLFYVYLEAAYDFYVYSVGKPWSVEALVKDSLSELQTNFKTVTISFLPDWLGPIASD